MEGMTQQLAGWKRASSSQIWQVGAGSGYTIANIINEASEDAYSSSTQERKNFKAQTGEEERKSIRQKMLHKNTISKPVSSKGRGLDSIGSEFGLL